jgi:peptidoglycan/LPS O-acetylase OafA/YrhL
VTTVLERGTPPPTLDRERGPDHAPHSARRYLDGMRGLSAIYVVLHHMMNQLGWVPLPRPLILIGRFAKYGHYAVAVFIVLSGYCLMLPVANSSERRLRGGFSGYIRRRARRIIPPYYAALALCLAVIALVPALRTPGGTLWDDSLPALTSGVILSHFALVHNLSEEWIGKIDGPLWSVATEWQIYFAFPILLWFWRRWGIGRAVVAGFAVGYGILAVSLACRSGFALGAAPWYLGLFAVGMAATVGRSGRPWGRYALVLLLAAGAFSVVDGKFRWMAALGLPQRVLLDAIVGVATACLILHLEGSTKDGDAVSGERQLGIVRRLLESRPALWLGSFSYSLYLIHDPLLAWSNLAMHRAGWSGSARLAAMPVVLPAVVGIAYLFYLAFERRFVGRGASAERRLSDARPSVVHVDTRQERGEATL